VRRETVFDAVVVGALGALGISLVLSVTDRTGQRLLYGLLVVAHVAPLLLRRRHPVQVLAAMAGTAVVSVPIGAPVVVLGPAALVAVHAVGARSSPRTARVAVGVAALVMTVVVAANGMDLGTVVTNLSAFGVAWWLGDRVRRAAVDTQAQRVLALEGARRAAADERARIARELHDVVAHTLSVIAVQAGTGRFVIDASPEVARDALVTIEEASRGAMQEMRRLLSVLRDEDVDGGGLVPAPGLGDVGSLVAGTLGTGVDIDLRVEGERRAVPAGVDLCAYRIVQEALTNVCRHAHARRASVTVRYDPDAVAVEVVDDGVGSTSPAGHGHGLLGMRERAGLYGGDVEVGAVPGGGYRVRARIPLVEPA
jgi:signal transduction histidine kinase